MYKVGQFPCTLLGGNFRQNQKTHGAYSIIPTFYLSLAIILMPFKRVWYYLNYPDIKMFYQNNHYIPNYKI